ncbi:RluA family pseudouridine synthase [Ureaplasma ceti]|uniref:Pseudouridine synthase n=1 Tax=Ureaplasma ceti TaxID=3119530 RepID=A0ABP9UBQ9_9BACT
MKKITINTNDANQRLDNFLLKSFPKLTKAVLYKAIRNKRVKVNNKRITDIAYKVVAKDVLELYINDEFLEKVVNTDFNNSKDELDIVYEDANVIVVNKPLGLVVHEDNDKQNADTLINRIKKYLMNKGEWNPNHENSFAPALGHRLDRNTSGLIVSAKNFEALQSLQNCFKNQEVSKNYLGLVHGVLEEGGSQTLKLYIKDDETGIVKVSDSKLPEYKESITKFKTVGIVKNKYSLVDINLITGRKHQIRASFQWLGFPLVGEKKYISKSSDRDYRFKYQCLVSYKLKFNIKDKNDCLAYLNSKTFELKKSNIWFIKKINSLN